MTSYWRNLWHRISNTPWLTLIWIALSDRHTLLLIYPTLTLCVLVSILLQINLWLGIGLLVFQVIYIIIAVDYLYEMGVTK